MSAAAVFEERVDPGQLTSALMSAAVHLLLLAVLIFGVRWQNRPPESVEVELWLPPPTAPVVEAPKPEPAPTVVEPPRVEPAPPKPEPVVPKPEIVERKAPPPKPKPVPKVEHKPVPPKPVAKAEPKPKPEPPKAVAKSAPPRDDEAQRRIREQLLREQASLQVDHERQRLKDMNASAAASANSKAQASWIDKVRSKIRGNMVLAFDIKGNPEALVGVEQLPNGEVLQVRIKRSSGIAALDDAIERAVRKSSPLPRPDGAGFTAPREFEFRYKPFE